MENLNKSMEVSKLLREILHMTKQLRSKGFENMGVTMSQGMVIGVLVHSDSGKMKISELSSMLGLSDSTVSGIIDRMEKLELVERIRSDEDRRVVFVKLSKKFEKEHCNSFMHVDELFMSIINRGTTEDMNKIVEGLSTLRILLKEHLEE